MISSILSTFHRIVFSLISSVLFGKIFFQQLADVQTADRDFRIKHRAFDADVFIFGQNMDSGYPFVISAYKPIKVMTLISYFSFAFFSNHKVHPRLKFLQERIIPLPAIAEKSSF